MQSIYSFPKCEHLCGDIRITRLYTEGKAFIVYPLRVVYRIATGKEKIPVKVLVGVPKKRFKRAVKRNKLKRIMRESYRLNKYILSNNLIDRDLHLEIAFNYVSDQEVDFVTMESKMKNALQKIITMIEQPIC